MVARLVAAGFDYCSVMAMAWTDARDFLAAHARIRRDALVEAAVAARAAQADEKSWKAWVKEVGREA